MRKRSLVLRSIEMMTYPRRRAPEKLPVNARRFASRAGNVFRIRTRIGVGLDVGAAFSSQFQHSIAESAQELTIV